MSDPRSKTLRDLLSELDQVTEQALKLAERTQPPLEEELIKQLRQRAQKSQRKAGTRDT